MIRIINIQCPHCHETCELYLSSNASVVILNCPDCWTPLLHNENGVFILTQDQIDEIISRNDFSIETLLEKVAQSGNGNDELMSVHGDKNECHSNGKNASPASSHFSVLRNAIGTDDIIDLHLGLRTCKDSLEFINNL